MVAADAGVTTEVARNRPRVEATMILRSINTSIGMGQRIARNPYFKRGARVNWLVILCE
jgi:hypothetical protein